MIQFIMIKGTVPHEDINVYMTSNRASKYEMQKQI